MSAIVNIAKAQLCTGSWALQRPIAFECISGQWIGWQNTNNPPGCPTNPMYVGVQTNTFTFINPVGAFSIDFTGFDGTSGCARIEIKVNGVFYPLAAGNFIDFPLGSTCVTGSFSNMALTTDGYLTNSLTGGPGITGTGRIIISNVNAINVSVSTNDGNGTLFSNPFNCLPVVPLKLLSFKGHSSFCKTQLNWETGIEQNVKNIKIQKSDDGALFYNIGEVSPKGSNSQYSFVVTNLTEAYFRLKINDFDGYYEYSNILSLKSNCNNIVYQVMPNPATNSVEIIGLKNYDEICVLDILGRIVLTFNSAPNYNKFDIHKITPGMYILQVINNGKIRSNLKFIKN